MIIYFFRGQVGGEESRYHIFRMIDPAYFGRNHRKMLKIDEVFVSN